MCAKRGCGGVFEYDRIRGILDNYDNPDGESEMVPSKVQGVIGEIVTRVRYRDNDLLNHEIYQKE
jgi:hypothetical protein